MSALRDLAAHYAGVRERLGVRRTRVALVSRDVVAPRVAAPVAALTEPEAAPPEPEPVAPVPRRRVPSPLPIDHPSGMSVGLTPSEARWQIIRDVEAEMGVTFDEMLGLGRSLKILRARRKVAARLRSELGLSYPRIAFLMERDHTSIINLLNPKKQRRTNNGQG